MDAAALRKIQCRQRQDEIEQLKERTFFHNTLPGGGWRLCFVFANGEICTPAVISFEVTGDMNRDYGVTAIHFFDQCEQRIGAVLFDGTGKADTIDFVGLLEPGQLVPRDWKRLAR